MKKGLLVSCLVTILCGIAFGGADFQSSFLRAARPHALDVNHAFALGFGEAEKVQLVQYRETREAEAKVEGFGFVSEGLSKRGEEFLLPDNLRVSLALLENHRARESQTLRLDFWRNGHYFVTVYEGSSSGFKPVRSSRLEEDQISGFFWAAFRKGLSVAFGVLVLLIGVMFIATRRARL